MDDYTPMVDSNEARHDFQAHVDAGLEFHHREVDKNIFTGTKKQWDAYVEATGNEEALHLDANHQKFLEQLIFTN